MIPLSRFAGLVQPSATLAAGAKARELRARGVTVYDFSLGEPDQATPAHVCEAAARAMRDGHTHYTPAAGTAAVRAAVARFYARHYGWDVSPGRVVVSNGAKHAIHNALVATVGPGDEVIIPTPYWVSYGDLVWMAGATPVLIETTPESGFKLTPDQFRAAVSPRTKLLMLNSPCNPTGTVYTRAELEALVDAVLETDVTLLTDEIYEQLCYGGAEPTCVATLRPELPPRTITVSGASKTYAMTGWRMGWAVSPEHLAAAMANIQSQETGCPNSVAQAALAAALDGPQDCVRQMRDEYAARRELVFERLAEIPGLQLHHPDGAFYAFFGVGDHLGRALGTARPVADSAGFCAAALEVAHVNMVPGSAFGREGWVRMSYAAGREQLDGGLTALHQWLCSN